MKLIKLPNKTTDTNKMLDELRITNLVVVCKNKGDLLFKLSWKQRLKRRHSISPYGFHIEERFTYYFSWRERFTYGYHWKSSYRGEIHICFLWRERFTYGYHWKLLWSGLMEIILMCFGGKKQVYCRYIDVYIFALVINELTRHSKQEFSWCFLSTDDIALVDETRENIFQIRNVEITLNSKGFKLESGIRRMNMCVCVC